MPRNNVLLQRLSGPKRVQLPSGHVFFAKYQRVVRDGLPERVKIRKTQVTKIGHRRQRIQRIGPKNQRNIAMAIGLGKKVAGSRFGKMMINNAIDYIPTSANKKL